MPQIDDEIVAAFLTPQEVAKVRDDLRVSYEPSARLVEIYINDSLPPNYLEDADIHFSLEISAAEAPESNSVLDSAIRKATKGGTSVPDKTFADRLHRCKNWGLALHQEYFHELRDKICGKGKRPAALSNPANTVLSALGVAVWKLLGVSNPLAMGIAVLIVTNVASIGKTTLCRMTSPDELARYFG